ncbi:MAG: arsenate reductase ArsC [Pontiella sp.]
MNKKISLLYLCTGNSCRSQMAEGWTRALKGAEIEVYSAGLETHGLNPNAVTVMAEAGMDISTQKSQHIDEFKNTKIDYVITVCNAAHETCPWFPANCKVIHIGFDDPPKLSPADAPAAVKLEGFRRVRDEIKAFVETLPDVLESGK